MNFIIRNTAATMASISGTGIDCAAPTAASGNSRRRASLLALPLILLATTGASTPGADLAIAIDGLRNDKGAVMLCLTRRTQDQFLQCRSDPARITRVVASNAARRIEVDGLRPGDYSLLVIHDENRNGKLDKMMGIPREGFGFSRNPAIRMGPPKYDQVHFAVPAGHSAQTIKLRYLL